MSTEKSKLNSRTKDITGKVYNYLTVIKFMGYQEFFGANKATWLCMCTCGNTIVLNTGAIKSGNNKSCGCMQYANRPYKHRAKGTKAYNSWRAIKDRCYDKNHMQFKDYGGRGVTMDQMFKEDFLAFLAEVGNPPDDGQRWTIDRIDNELGYVPGNIRWATSHQQARNKRKSARCKTGITGVHRRVTTKGLVYYCACWTEWSGGNKSKRCKLFSVKKLGEQVAFDEAVKFREAKIKQLNEMGYGYSETYGK